MAARLRTWLASVRTPEDVPWTPGRVLAFAFLAVSTLLLVAVGTAGESAAKPGLGRSEWAPTGLLSSWAPGPALVTGMLWAAYGLGAAGVLLHLHLGLPRLSTRGMPWWLRLGLTYLAVLALWSVGPFGSADHTNYAAYGRIAALGGDPYLTPPNAWPGADAVISAVRPPWDGTPSVYGPFATLLQMVASWFGGDNLHDTVWAWLLVVILAWGAVPALLVSAGAPATRVRALWTANPLILGVGLFGAHVDILVAALVVLTIWAAPRSAWVAGLFAGLTVSTKITAGVVLVGVLAAWWSQERRGFAWRATQFVGVALVTAGALLWWAGSHVFDQLDRARRSISFATPWRPLFQALAGPMSASSARNLVAALSILVALVLVVVLTRLTQRLAPATVVGASARWTFVLATAYALAAAYSLPWYVLTSWALLPVLAASVLDRAMLLHLFAVTVAYVPGRVETMTPAVERVTLWVRRVPVPYAVLAVWAWLTLAAVRGSRRPSSPRPPAP
ncbi:glycosyltransferase 87 family protein [Knoellia koreensis]|uniref:DUF2029 domain-containing protein n=1 Tax=Knoellia koreensis TaxID=2730921 RepID=A0A849HL82_9MICO|nr:glycosyltransferase 87 family protein [Knoellia sp. DB2414S]NNM47433.1 DUF2029 domain-containing protein [Knoellia sp. DB2414S]